MDYIRNCLKLANSNGLNHTVDYSSSGKNKLTLSPDSDYSRGYTPEPLFRTNSFSLENSVPSETLRDNREDYVIYENMKLETICGIQGNLDDHTYVVKYYRMDAVLSNHCDMCGVCPYDKKEPGGRCVDCDSYLCLPCYNYLRDK